MPKGICQENQGGVVCLTLYDEPAFRLFLAFALRETHIAFRLSRCHCQFSFFLRELPGVLCVRVHCRLVPAFLVLFGTIFLEGFFFFSVFGWNQQRGRLIK